VAIEYRWADDQADRLSALASELVQRRVAVIAAIGGIPSVFAAKAATTTIPIVFLVAECPWYQKKPPALPTRRFILPARLANSSDPQAAFCWSPGAWLAEGGQVYQLSRAEGGAARGC